MPTQSPPWGIPGLPGYDFSQMYSGGMPRMPEMYNQPQVPEAPKPPSWMTELSNKYGKMEDVSPWGVYTPNPTAQQKAAGITNPTPLPQAGGKWGYQDGQQWQWHPDIPPGYTGNNSIRPIRRSGWRAPRPVPVTGPGGATYYVNASPAPPTTEQAFGFSALGGTPLPPNPSGAAPWYNPYQMDQSRVGVAAVSPRF